MSYVLNARLGAADCGLVVGRGVSHRNYNVGVAADLADSGEIVRVGLGSKRNYLDYVGVFLNESGVGLQNVE